MCRTCAAALSGLQWWDSIQEEKTQFVGFSLGLLLLIFFPKQRPSSSSSSRLVSPTSFMFWLITLSRSVPLIEWVSEWVGGTSHKANSHFFKNLNPVLRLRQLLLLVSYFLYDVPVLLFSVFSSFWLHAGMIPCVCGGSHYTCCCCCCFSHGCGLFQLPVNHFTRQRLPFVHRFKFPFDGSPVAGGMDIWMIDR